MLFHFLFILLFIYLFKSTLLQVDLSPNIIGSPAIEFSITAKDINPPLKSDSVFSLDIPPQFTFNSADIYLFPSNADLKVLSKNGTIRLSWPNFNGSSAFFFTFGFLNHNKSNLSNKTDDLVVKIIDETRYQKYSLQIPLFPLELESYFSFLKFNLIILLIDFKVSLSNYTTFTKNNILFETVLNLNLTIGNKIWILFPNINKDAPNNLIKGSLSTDVYCNGKEVYLILIL